MSTTEQPLTGKELIDARLAELAPYPHDADVPDPSLIIARVAAVQAEQRWHRNMSRKPFFDPEWPEDVKRAWADSIAAQSAEFAVTHLLMAFRVAAPEAADMAAAEVKWAWDFGEPVGDLLRGHLRTLGVDPDEVDHLEDARQALPGNEATP